MRRASSHLPVRSERYRESSQYRGGTRTAYTRPEPCSPVWPPYPGRHSGLCRMPARAQRGHRDHRVGPRDRTADLLASTEKAPADVGNLRIRFEKEESTQEPVE